jgi:hypothetical protein
MTMASFYQNKVMNNTKNPRVDYIVKSNILLSPELVFAFLHLFSHLKLVKSQMDYTVNAKTFNQICIYCTFCNCSWLGSKGSNI